MASLNGEVLPGTTDNYSSDEINKSKAGEFLPLADATALPGATTPGSVNFG